MASASKHLTGHSDLVLGYVATRDPRSLEAMRGWRALAGAIPGPFEVWLAHRSLPTLAVRLERQEANARALVAALPGRAGARRWPGFGSVLIFVLRPTRRRRFLARCTLVAEATSFGGVHSSAERRARWGTDDVPAGLIRFSAGSRTRTTWSPTCGGAGVGGGATAAVASPSMPRRYRATRPGPRAGST